MQRASFVDRHLLQSYFDLVKSTVPSEKRRELSVTLGLTGVKGQITQKEQPRQLSEGEMIATVIRAHEKKGTLARTRPLEWSATLVLERCTAVRVEVPRPPDGTDAGLPIVLWVSLGEQPGTLEHPTHGTLCLIEQYHGPTLGELSRPSEYSLFAEVVLAISLDGRKNLLAERLGMTRVSQIDGNNAWDKSEGVLEPFTNDPVGVLTRLGCKSGQARNIEVLYEVREAATDWASHFRTVTVFGYPIVVSNAL